MRISTIQVFNRGVEGITDTTGQTAKTQAQIASGVRVQTPSDDPVASARILQLDQDKARRDQYISNIDSAKGRLELEEAQLSAVNDVIIRLKELTVQAGNGTYSHADRQTLADEIDERLRGLADLMNSQDANGEYVFSGFMGGTKPFEKTDGGSFIYQGDEGQRFINVSSSTMVAINDSGKGIFVDIPSAQNSFITAAGVNNTSNPAATITQGLIVDQVAYDAFYPEDMIITFNDPTLVVPNQSNYTITLKSDGREVVSNVPFNGGNITANGVQVSVFGNPNVGDRFTIESTPTQGLLTTVGRLAEGLRNFDNTQRTELSTLLANTLDNLDNGLTSVLQVQSKIGARINSLDSTRDVLGQVDIASNQILSDLRDLDYAEAVSRLSFESFILEAAQQSYIKIANLSLFNFIR